MLDPTATFALAERVSDAARQLGFETALIGAAALAVHGYPRGTIDLDLAVFVNPNVKLPALQATLEGQGLECELRLPDDDDPLGGMLRVRDRHAHDPGQFNLVEVVNFAHPLRALRSPARDALARAQPIADSTLRCVTLEDLVAFKLYAGGRSDLADIEQLLARNPGIDLDAVRAAAGPYDREGALETLISAANTERNG